MTAVTTITFKNLPSVKQISKQVSNMLVEEEKAEFMAKMRPLEHNLMGMSRREVTTV